MAAERFLQDEERRAEKSFRLKLPRCERSANWKKHFSFVSYNNTLRHKSILISTLPQDKWELSIVLKKDVKGACQRNRIKRIIREVYRTTKPFLYQSMSMLFTVDSNPKKLSYSELQSAIIENFGAKK